eukprot:1417148-Lingulodinium_polyedra.AAC.1
MVDAAVDGHLPGPLRVREEQTPDAQGRNALQSHARAPQLRVRAERTENNGGGGLLVAVGDDCDTLHGRGTLGDVEELRDPHKTARRVHARRYDGDPLALLHHVAVQRLVALAKLAKLQNDRGTRLERRGGEDAGPPVLRRRRGACALVPLRVRTVRHRAVARLRNRHCLRGAKRTALVAGAAAAPPSAPAPP